jgi:hypothetical protein
MTSKNMPGFTAAAALYQTDASYRAVSSAGSVRGDALQPAVSYPCWLHCKACRLGDLWACIRCNRCAGRGLFESMTVAF